jgi:formate hydrogenlyase subunit 6/NADH:ubiquinone oxidoreductase subunit I
VEKMFKILQKTLKSGTVTTKYPEEKETAPEGFRGRPELIPDKCTYCGNCVAACPPDVIWLLENKGEKKLILSYCGCIFCGRCEEVCSSGAIRLTQEYEMASRTKDDQLVSIRRKM